MSGKTRASAKKRPLQKLHPQDSKTADSLLTGYRSHRRNPGDRSPLAVGADDTSNAKAMMDEIAVSELQHAGKIEKIFSVNDQ
jgi:hypothetical protein